VTRVRFLLLCFFATIGAVLRGQVKTDLAFAYRDEEQRVEIRSLPAGRFEFQALIEPGRFARKGELAFAFLTRNGEGFRVAVKPHAGGVMLERLGKSRATPAFADRRNPTMNLAEGDYTFRLPFRLKVLFENGKAQLYLGFHGLPADFLHAELDPGAADLVRVEARAKQAEVRAADIAVTARAEPLPDSAARPPVHAAMPSWSEFVGTHYLPREPFHLYRGVFYDPIVYRCIANDSERPAENLRPWVAYAKREALPAGCEARVGPFSGREVWVDVARARQILDWAEKNDAVMVHGRDILKRTEYEGAEEIALRKDELYWSVRVLYEISPEQARKRIRLQLGNEVNAFHVPWKNHPDLVRRYVEYDFAPAAEAIRRASQDLFGTPERIPFLTGSVASPWPLGSGWLVAMANARIEGDWAPSLRGKSVASVASGVSMHYAVKGPFWSQALDAVYRRLVEPTDNFELWSTEEVGGNAEINRGPYVAAIPFRYLDWWSRRDWKPGRGAVIYWGDTRGGEHYTTAVDVQRLLGSFFGDAPLRNDTDAVQVRGPADAEVYAFATTGRAAGRVGVAVMSRDYWFYPEVNSTGRLQLARATLPVPEFRGKHVATAWYRVTDEKIVLVKRADVDVGAAGELEFPSGVALDRSREEILLGFAALAERRDVLALNYEPPVREPTRVIANGEIESFHLGNDLAVDLGGELTWAMLSDGGKAGRKLADAAENADAGMAGDHHGLSVDRRIKNELSFPITLQRGIGTATGELSFALRGDPVEVWWDGKLVAREVSPSKPVVRLANTTAFSPGRHELRLKNATGRSTSIDSLMLRDTVAR
jgi:hypothetical protein